MFDLLLRITTNPFYLPAKQLAKPLRESSVRAVPAVSKDLRPAVIGLKQADFIEEHSGARGRILRPRSPIHSAMRLK